jgi:hypothetical protein
MNPNRTFRPTLLIILIAGLLAPACGRSNKSDASADGRPSWPWDVQPNPLPDTSSPDSSRDTASSTETMPPPDVGEDRAIAADTATSDSPADAAPEDTAINPDSDEDTGRLDGNDDPSDPGTGDLCANGYSCLTSCENHCGLHNLGRSVCTCISNALHCSDCILSDQARPQVPQVVSVTCADGIATGVACARVGDACFLHPGWPYPDGCLCWSTPLGMVWNCAPVFDWFSFLPDAGPPGTGASPAAPR